MERKHRLKYKRVRCLEDVFQELNRDYVKINRNDRINNNKILYSVLDEIIKLMKVTSPLFNCLKPRFEYMGSYFDGLRVGHPTEYDINIVLKLPINYDKIVLDAETAPSGYTNIIMPSEFRRLSITPATAEKFKETKTWCDSSYRLSVRRFRSWMQSVLDAALNTLTTENGKKVLKVKNELFYLYTKLSGPANTIYIQGPNIQHQIDVDLVPTFAFDLQKKKPKNASVVFEKVEHTNIMQYFVVPKPTDNCYSWRLTFPFQERSYITDKNNMKSAIKLLKLFRDIQAFDGLASYYIKTLFLWEAESQKEEIFWKKNSLSFLVLHMLKKLRNCLEKGNIPNFWCPSHNLLENIKAATMQNWCNRVSFIINDIEKNSGKNPYVINYYFIDKNK